MQAIKVKFPGSEKEYTYQTTLDVQIGDVVRAPVGNKGFVNATVVRIGAEYDEGIRLRTISEFKSDEKKKRSSRKLSLPDDGSEIKSMPRELEIFRDLYGGVFPMEDFPDSQIIKLIKHARGRFGWHHYSTNRPYATAALVAHWLTLAQQAYEEAQGNMPIASITAENASMSFVTSNTNLALDDAYLRKTPYGLSILDMRQPAVISV